MIGIDPKRLERRLRWAAEQLGLRPDATLDEVRAAWLRRLPAEDFVPSSELRWALAALLRRQPEGGWEARANEAASVAEEERLRGEVEAFAEKFWDLPPDERRRNWQELMDRCDFAPALRARLRLLEAGLDCVPVVNEAKETMQVVELANQVRELFILRPGSRARARQDILQRIRDDRKAWKVAARRLRRICPKLAALGKDLLDKVGKATPKPLRLSKLRASQPTTAENKPRKIPPMWIFYIIAVAVSQIVRIGCDHSSPREKINEIERLSNEELKKHVEELRRREQKQQEEKHDKSDGKHP